MNISSRLTLTLAGLLFGGLSAQAAVSISQIPLSKSETVPPNVVLLMDTSGSMADLLPNSSESRLDAAKRIAKDLINNNADNVRFGLFRLDGTRTTYRAGRYQYLDDANSYNGARLIQPAGASVQNLLSGIDSLTANGSTPVAEALYEVTRYYRGMSSAYQSGVNYSSPLQYRCQANYTIMLTDGEPQYDSRFPGNDPDALTMHGQSPDEYGTRNSLPDWDGKHDTNKNVRFSDGPRNDISNVGDYLYVDDIALLAWDLDIADRLSADLNDDSTRERRRLHTYTVGFTTAQQMLQDAAEYGRGQYYTADDADQLQSALSQAIAAISSQSGAAASTTANSSSLDSGTHFYQATYDPKDWSGSILARQVNSDGSLGSAVWDTGSSFPSAAGRHIYTWRATAGKQGGVTFQLANLDAEVQTALAAGGDSSLAQKRVDWLRGDRSREDGVTLRKRSTLMGDVINSNLLFMGGAQSYGFDRLGNLNPSDSAEELGQSSYRDYLQKKAQRAPVLFAGANDGMLHAFHAETGQELFAFIPRGVAEKLALLTSPGYGGGAHRYYVDGGLSLSDVYLNGQWHTLLVGSLGAGGRSVFALDVTDPENFGTEDILWEYSDSDLGLTFGTPQIGPLANGNWGVLFGNGYNSDRQRAMLYVLSAESGALLAKIDSGDAANPAGSANGLSSPAALPDSRRIIQSAYAGDLLGNLWKFDLSTDTAAGWGVALKSGNQPKPLFQAGNSQPITAKPTIGSVTNAEGQLIYFGTGRYLGAEDKGDTSLQAFYAVWDDGKSNGKPLTPDDLYKRSISLLSQNGQSYRQVDTGRFTIGTGQGQSPGWYLPLVTSAGAEGERVIYEARLRYDRVIFVTAIPTLDPCVAGGRSWLMELDAQSGARLPYSVFDTDGDGDFDGNDGLVSGMPFDDGIVGSPSIISGGNIEYKYMGSTSGAIKVVNEQGGFESGRQSWLQLR